MLHLVSGTNSLYLFVNLILVPVPPFPTHLFLHPSVTSSCSETSDSPLCSSITPSPFHSRLKTYLFHKSYSRSFTSSSRTACLHGLLPGPFLLSYSVFVFSFTLFFHLCVVLVPAFELT